MKKKYDLAFSFGPACSCSQTLRKAGLQMLSFPFDWIGPAVKLPGWDEDVRRRADLLASGSNDWLHEEDFEYIGDNTNGKAKYWSSRLQHIFVHDFPIGVPLSESFPGVAAKYARRIERLLALMRRSKRILVARLDRPDLDYRTPIADCQYARETLSKAFAPAQFDFLLIQQDASVPFGRQALETIEPGLFRLRFDYLDTRPGAEPAFPRIDLTAAAVSSLFSVREYRTKEEIAAHRLTKMRKRWAKYGATSAWQYQAFRIRRIFRGILCTIGPRALVARCRRHKIAHVMPIGKNCEIAFRFYRRWGFVESSLFAWAATKNLATTAAALGNIDALPDGAFELNERARMWRHAGSSVHFHGKLHWQQGDPVPPQQDLERDLADLRGRLRHLVDKFHKTIASGREILFVHRLDDDDATSPDLAARLDALEEALVRLGAKNWRLLVVCRAADRPRMPAAPGGRRLYRSVADFNPPSHVTWPDLGDPVGWDAIFSEFAPEKILPKAHSFKFE